MMQSVCRWIRNRPDLWLMFVALSALSTAESCYAQVSGLQEVLRYDGTKDNQTSGVSILRASQHGVAVSLTRFG